MTEVSVLKNQLSITEREHITSGSVNVYQVHFHFSSHWDDLEKVAIFRTPDFTINVPIENNLVVVPWEVMTTPGYAISIGVYGLKALEVILPTVWGLLGTVEEGVIIGDAESGDHTPDIYDAILGKVEEVDNKLDNLTHSMDELYKELPIMIDEYLKENPPSIPQNTLNQIINNYLEQNPIQTLTREEVQQMINETVGDAISDGY